MGAMMSKFRILICLLAASTSLFYVKTTFAEHPKPLILMLSGIELRKNQREELEKNINFIKKRFDDIHKIFTEILYKINQDIADAQQKQQYASGQELDYLGRKIALLNDRSQNIFDFQELWKERIDICERHIKLLDDIIDFLQSPRHELKSAYSWKEFRDMQIRIAEYVVKIQNDKNRRENIKKQKAAALERLISWEKQHEVKHKEHEKLVFTLESGKKTQQEVNAVQYEAGLLSQELSALSEKIDHIKLLIEKLDDEAKLWDDLIDLEQNKVHEQKNQILHIENRLVLDYNDVESAKAEWKNALAKALAVKQEINALREPKKQSKEKNYLALDSLKQRLAELKQQGTKDQESYLFIKTQSRKLNALVGALEKELLLYDAKKELADMLAKEKELQFNMVELRYKLKMETDNFEVLLSMFQNKKDLAISSLKALKDQRTDAIASLIETNRAIDKIKTTQEKIKQDKRVVSRYEENRTPAILNLLGATKDILTRQLAYTQSFLAVNADLITHQEKIINHIDLILNELDARYKTHNVWKRSPKAISLEALSQAMFEAEAFFKKLYWETPSRFKPSAFVQFFKSIGFYELFMLILCALFYVAGFILCRLMLTLIRDKIRSVVEKYQGYTRYLYLHLALAIVNFSLEHFTLLYTWLFFFLHVFTDFNYIFSTLLPFASNYSMALFYLISIPILIFLASGFIDQIKNLNKQLSFFFFTETFQDKFIMLITVFCYATAVLIPLRLAIISYTNLPHSEFATVIFAAYSLILVVIFLLGFSKEDVLKFFPSHSTFFIIIKRKIDRHYYPVFIFIMSLFILANPYVGYSNMAWFLAFAVPSSVLLLYVLFIIHSYVRKYAVFLFMKEEDDDMIDKFEHAKAYYGFFVIFSFLVLFLAAFILILRIWGVDYTPSALWKALSQEWVIRFGLDNKIGLIEFMTLGLFITIGFLVSSLIHKFILNRLFEILRSEPGTQNTISRISHYSAIFFSIILGLNAIHLEQFIFWVGASFGIVLGLSLKEIISDLVAGFFVLIERPIEIGNYIQIDSVQGTVHKISARSTTIITALNHSVIVPNKDLVNKWIINWGHGRFAIGFEINIRVDLKSDIELVKKTLHSIIQSNQYVLKVPGIVVRLEDIEPDAYFFLSRAFISARRVKEQWEIAALLRSEIVKAFKDIGIAFAKPARVIEFAGVDNDKTKSVEITFDR